MNESAYVLCNTSDGGYAIMGTTTSFGAGGNDSWLLKTDAVGNLQWNKTYGGTSDDDGIHRVSDSGWRIRTVWVMTYSFGAGAR